MGCKVVLTDSSVQHVSLTERGQVCVFLAVVTFIWCCASRDPVCFALGLVFS